MIFLFNEVESYINNVADKKSMAYSEESNPDKFHVEGMIESESNCKEKVVTLKLLARKLEGTCARQKVDITVI